MTVTAPEPVSATDARRRGPSRVGSRRLPALLAVALVVALAVGVFLWLHRDPGSAPYQDADAKGRLTLCSAAGHAVTSGSVTDRLGAVVGRTPAEGAADGAAAGAAAGATEGATATLFAYQPRQGVGASEWTGLPLTAPGEAGASAPVLRLGAGTVTLAQFLSGYPATWDGWVQLRLVVSSPAAGSVPTYDSVDVRVDGDRWRAVDPGTATCPA